MSLGKSLYVEKPLAHTFEEVELMMAAEKKYKVAAQMGNQGHSGNNYFQFKKWVDAGIIKNVTRVDAYMNKHRRWHGWEIDGLDRIPRSDQSGVDNVESDELDVVRVQLIQD